MKICPIIISGGVGSRLWPLSRSAYPKQFIKLLGERSLFQETLLRIKTEEIIFLDPVIVCNEEHRFIVAEQIKEINFGSTKIILEPSQKNTAPAIALASIYLKNTYHDEDLSILILPSDQLISPSSKFTEFIKPSIDYLQDNMISTFGIEPDSPNTGFGYIEIGKALDESPSIKEVNSFKEKPELDLAEKYLNEGNYLWNSGIYLLKLNSFIKSLTQLHPKIIYSCKKSIDNMIEDHDFIRPDKKNFIQCESISIDYALIEKHKDIEMKVINSLLDLKWSDVGTLKSLSEVLDRDENGNSIIGDVEHEGSNNSLLYSDSGLLAALNVNDMMIVKKENTVLVAPKSQHQNIGNFFSQLKNKGRTETALGNKVHRPWGTYEVLYESEICKIKKIIVYPHSKLSLQSHKKRSEHWVVITGSALAQCEEDIIELQQNESIYIPIGMKHSLENNKNDLLEIIEVQTGIYLGEDDIVRFEDIYGRVNN